MSVFIIPMHLEYVPKAIKPDIPGFSLIHETKPVTFGKSFFKCMVSI